MTQRHNQAERMMIFVDDCIVDSGDQDLSTSVPVNARVK